MPLLVGVPMNPVLGCNPPPFRILFLNGFDEVYLFVVEAINPFANRRHFDARPHEVASKANSWFLVAAVLVMTLFCLGPMDMDERE